MESDRRVCSLLAVALLVMVALLPFNVAVAQTNGFTLTLSNSSVSIPQYSSGTLTIFITATGGFGQTLSLSYSGPPGVSAYFNGNGPNQIVASPGGSTSSTATLYVDGSVAPGSYPLTITGTSPAGYSSSAAVDLVVTPGGNAVSSSYPDFLTQPNPAVVTLTPSQSRSTSIVFSSENGFSSSISLSAAWSGVAPNGVTFALQSPVAVPTDGSATSILTLTTSDDTSTGTYTLAITATNGVLTHASHVTVTIAGAPSVLAPVTTDFSISSFTPFSNPIILAPNTSRSTTITISSIGGFTSPITLSASWDGSVPDGVSFNLSNPVTAVPAGGNASSTLTVSASSSPSAESYTILLTATSGNGAITHSTVVPITVDSLPA